VAVRIPAKVYLNVLMFIILFLSVLLFVVQIELMKHGLFLFVCMQICLLVNTIVFHTYKHLSII
jgi:hypothetical protein